MDISIINQRIFSLQFICSPPQSPAERAGFVHAALSPVRRVHGGRTFELFPCSKAGGTVLTVTHDFGIDAAQRNNAPK
jgi:hypothetical protein